MMTTQDFDIKTWQVEKIAVIGAGIVGLPMAALLAQARILQGFDKPAHVIIIQRDSPTSGWKVDAINSGRSPIGGVEPELAKIVEDEVSAGILSASHDYEELRDADVILICVQTDKKDFAPDYRPLFEALTNIAQELKKKSTEKVPLIIFESTLAPTSMNTLVRDHFARFDLIDGRDIFIGNSPNRVMPGYLIERIKNSDKVIGGLNALTPKLIESLYSHIVEKGVLHLTNSLTAEIVKTLENAYRDVRIAFAAEIARYCDTHDIDFYQLRDDVNSRLSWGDTASKEVSIVPSGGLLIPTVGVGGHCLPKDGILLLWRKLENCVDISGSLILEARRINDESPSEVVRSMERNYGHIAGKNIALLGVAYRANSEDTRNSPTLVLANLLLQKGCQIVLHDPYVRINDQNLSRYDVQNLFTRDMEQALGNAEFIIFCTAHKKYLDDIGPIIQSVPDLSGVFDACNLIVRSYFEDKQFSFAGIGKGKNPPAQDFIDFVHHAFLAVEKGFANEIQFLIDFVNENYAEDSFNHVGFQEVKKIAGTCITGCRIANPGPLDSVPTYKDFIPRLVECTEVMST